MLHVLHVMVHDTLGFAGGISGIRVSFVGTVTWSTESLYFALEPSRAILAWTLKFCILCSSGQSEII